MKQLSQAILISALLHTVSAGFSQVTKLSNNTDLEYGVPYGNIAILISSQSDSLWRTDGTPANTFRYAPNVAADSPYQVTLFQNKIFFAGITAANGKELWVTDGTNAGTQLFKDIVPGASGGNPMNFLVFNNFLYFIAQTAANGFEIWKSDGTEVGTTLLVDINPGAGASSVDLTTTLFPNGPYFYFAANNGTAGTELWRSDGTTGGTIMLKDISPGPASSNPFGFTAFNLNTLFTASEPTTGNELWITDGSAGNASMVKDIATGPFGSSPTQLLLFNNKIYFDALDFTNGFEPWVTDGTGPNTQLLKDIDPGFESSFPLLFNSVFANNKFYFPAFSTAGGSELWNSDGTTPNTLQFNDINPGPGSSSPIFLLDFFGGSSINAIHSKLFNGKMFMYAYTPTNGREPWITDLTPGGTMLLKDINLGADSSINDSLTYFYTPNALYFSATDGSTGHELWRSDGTAINTNRLIDINPGNPGSHPNFLLMFNGIYLFTAHDGDNGTGFRDLFRLDGVFQPLPINSLAFSGSKVDNTVKLNWSTISELNTDHFDVERSKNGSQFEKIGSVNASGNSTLKIEYSFNDAEAFQSVVPKLFYRLKVFDKDGRSSYSNVITISIDRDSKLFYTYPNPVKGEVTVRVNTGNHKQSAIQIIDANGKHLYHKNLHGRIGNGAYKIDISGYRPGVYFIVLFTDEGVKAMKFVRN